MDVRNIPIDHIHPNPWNPNKVDAKTLEKIKADIEKKGLIQPIVVRGAGKDKWEIVDGEHRWGILQALGYQEAPCIVADMSDTEAKLKTIQLNYARGNPIPVKLAAVVHDLNKTMTLDDIEAALPYSVPELKDSLSLLKLPSDIDKVVEERAKKERQGEPVFISATIYKDHERSLFDFIEQAMLEGETTFCEIKVKVECPNDKFEMIVRAVQNLKALEKGREELDEERAPIVTRFAVFPEQLHIIDNALMHIIVNQELKKNARGHALELMAADYLAGADLSITDGGEDDGERQETPTPSEPRERPGGRRKTPKNSDAAVRSKVGTRGNRSGAGNKQKDRRARS